MAHKMIFEFGHAVVTLTSGDLCSYNEESPTNGLHSHKAYELSLVVSGSGRFLHGGEVYEIKKNDLFLAAPDVPHEIQAIYGGKSKNRSSLSFYYLSFDIAVPMGWKPDTFEERILWKFMESHTLIAVNQPRLIAYMKCLNEYRKNAEEDSLGVRYSLLAFLLDSLSALSQFSHPQAVQGYYNHIVDDAVNYIALHYTEKISMEMLAEICNTSIRNLQYVFRKHMNCTVVDYINRVRMNQAGCYLRMNYKVSEAGAKAGISDTSQFSRLFKKYYGVSPLKYQKDTLTLLSYTTELK